jgi:hypothetical protein
MRKSGFGHSQKLECIPARGETTKGNNMIDGIQTWHIVLLIAFVILAAICSELQ